MRDEIDGFFEKNSKTQLEQGLFQIKEDLIMILEFFTQKYDFSNKMNILKEKENLLMLSEFFFVL